MIGNLLTECTYEGDKFRIININDNCELTVKDLNTTLQTILTDPLTQELNLKTESPIITTLIESTIYKSTSVPISAISIDDLSEIDFYDKGEIVKGKTNQSKEDINLDKVINSIEIGKRRI